MNEMTLYFARHGETDWNAEGRWQGQTDVPLNAKGRLQAAALATRLGALGVRAVGTSDLVRANETAEIVARDLGLVVGLRDASFRERAYGPFEGLTREECKTLLPEAWARLEKEPDHAIPDVEPLELVAKRMLAGVRLAAERLAAPALIVSHGRSIRVLVGQITGREVPPIPNGGIYRILIQGDLIEGSLASGPTTAAWLSD
jgi:probable phosphoglycerate mutase